MESEDLIAKFVQWTKNKVCHHIDDPKKELYFREREVWWVALGKNIGFEQNGKHELFERPVIILKKYSKDICFVLPLTTKIKDPIPWYQIIVELEGKHNAVNITQGKTISSKRLLRKKCILDTDIFDKVVDIFTKQFYKDKK